MTRTTDYINGSQQRLLKLITVMFGDVVAGYTPGELAKAVSTSPGSMTRDLQNLLAAGMAECDESTGRWRLTPRLPQQAIKVWTCIDRAERQLQEAKNRFNRSTSY